MRWCSLQVRGGKHLCLSQHADSHSDFLHGQSEDLWTSSAVFEPPSWGAKLASPAAETLQRDLRSFACLMQTPGSVHQLSHCCRSTLLVSLSLRSSGLKDQGVFQLPGGLSCAALARGPSAWHLRLATAALSSTVGKNAVSLGWSAA